MIFSTREVQDSFQKFKFGFEGYERDHGDGDEDEHGYGHGYERGREEERKEEEEGDGNDMKSVDLLLPRYFRRLPLAGVMVFSP